MEFTNEIFFNKNLVAEESVIITYSGKLYREHSEDIFIVYGYGDNWEYTEETQMKETDNGFEVTLTLKNYDKINFCFKNNFNIWDNNSNNNYIAHISPKQVTTSIESGNDTNINSEEQTDNDNDNDNNNDNNTPLIDGTNSNSESSSSQTVETSDEEETNEEENTNEETSEKDTSTTENFESQSNDEAIFTNLLNSLLENIRPINESINFDNGYGLQSVDEIKEESFEESNENLLNEFFAELETIPAPEVKSTDLDELFAQAFKELEKSEDNQQLASSNSQELDALMNDIVNSITEEEKINASLISPIDKVEEVGLQEKKAQDIVSGLPAIQSENWFDKFARASYSFFKNASTALKKFGALVKLKAQEYGIINDKEE